MKKGFTLIELMGVIVLLGLVSIVSYVVIEKLILNSKENISEATKKIIYVAADNYIEDNMDDFPKEKEKNYCVSIDSLINGNYLDEDTISKDLKNLSSYHDVLVTVDSSYKFSYELVTECNVDDE